MSKTSDTSNSPKSGASDYVVLARKYRPLRFDDLIGQEVMVRTLRNAFAMERIAQAYMLTGVRGVGKTTTARILARALNYEIPGRIEKPTLDMPELGVHCQAIMESRHVDVLEMDAASNTGIDDIREIIEAVRYKPASARMRVFIIDEVHMLSKSAFNGLLKTLEEPPPHVKFIFATTEIRKVPVTILSRCQRFDLRRVEHEMLADHFQKIVEKEGHTADRDALLLIARASEGSVRDGLSLLDQGLTLGAGHVKATLVLDMLGLAGRGAAFGLLDPIFRSDTEAVLSALGELHNNGADPVMILNDLAEAVHVLTRQKAVPGGYPADFSAEDRERAAALVAKLSVPRLAMAWQMLLKGIDEATRAARPFAAAEMVLIRMCYAGGLPSPADIIDELRGRRNGAQAGALRQAPGTAAPTPTMQHEPPPQAPAPPRFRCFRDIAEYAGEQRDIQLKLALEEKVELLQFGPNFLEIHLLEGAPRNLAQELSRKLQAWTGERWVVSLSEKNGQRPLGMDKREEEAKALEEAHRHPAIKQILHHFPDARIESVRPLKK